MYKYTYSLCIMGSRRTYEKFDSLEGLKTEVARHFTKSEQHIVESLTTFQDNLWCELFDGYWEQAKTWRNFTVSAFRKEVIL